MGISDAIFNIFSKNKDKDKNFLSLVLTPRRVLASIWEFRDDLVHVLGTGEKPYKSVENLIHETAIAIDKAGQHVKGDVSKVVFGISQNWLQDQELSSDTSRFFKKLSKDLEIEPQAFIPLSSAINHLLKIKEGKPPECILLGAFEDFYEAHLLQGNKVIKTNVHKARLTEGGLQDLIKSLTEDRQLPNKIYVYGDEPSQTLEKLKKSPLKDFFSNSLHFEVLENIDLLTGVAFAQAADVLGHEPGIGPTPKDVQGEEPKDNKNLIKNELGFVEGEDILAQEELKPTLLEEESRKESNLPLELKEENLQPVNPNEEYAVTQGLSITEKQAKERKKFSFKFLPLPINFSKIPTKKIGIAAVALIIILLAAAYFFGQVYTQAKVIIKVNPKIQEGDYKAAVSTSAQESEIAGQEISAKVADSQKAVATGTKKTGEAAKGQVTVFNWTTSPTTLKKDAVIISKDGIKFKLDSDVQIASRSASNPGQGDVPVVAVDFGPSGNLSQGHDFTFKEYDELLYSARNDNPFSGGAEKQLTVVSQDDAAKLEKSLTTALEQKVKDQLKAENSDKTILDDALKIKVLNKQFDKKVDDEASLVNLNMELLASAIVYKETDLKAYLARSPGIKPDEGLEIRPQDIEISETSAKPGAGALIISGKFRAKEIPKLNEDELRAKISAKSLKEARALIKEIPQISDVDVKFSPSLPFVNSIPRNKSQIEFVIETS